jgi:hypothetical protein
LYYNKAGIVKYFSKQLKQEKIMKTIYVFCVILLTAAFAVLITSQDYTNQNYKDDLLIPVWSTGAPMLTYCSNAGSFSFNRNDTGWVYFVGGELTGGIITQKHERYNVKTNTWAIMAQYPAAGIWYTDGTTLGTFGYICGGMTGSPLNTCTAQLTRYDINSNTWAVMAPMPGSRAMGQIEGYQDSLLYYVAGFSSDGSGTALNTVYLYNRNSNTWRTATSLPAARIGGAMAISGDTIVWVGGITPNFIAGTIQPTPYRGVISQADRSVITWTTGTNYPGSAGYRQRLKAGAAGVSL